MTTPLDRSQDRPRGMGRATALISGATFVSRILGVLREQAFAALLGAGYYGDAFTMAFRLPNLLRDLFAEGALSAAFQPAFSQRRKEAGEQAAYQLANLVQTTLLCLVGTLCLLGVIFAPQLVAHWASGYAAIPGKSELTVLLTRIMMPFLLLISLAAVAMGMLNAEERFLYPALAPALFNLAAIGAGVGLWVGGVRHDDWAAIGWSIATLCGGALQFGVQLPALWRSGYRFRPRLDLRLRDPGLRQILLTMAPSVIGLAATQVNIFISSKFASSEDGANTWLGVAFRLMQLPIGMFGVAVGTVALARFSRSAADAHADQSALGEAMEGVRDTLRRGLRMVAFLTVPAAVGLIVLAEPIMVLLYQHGAFHHSDALAAAAALRLYGVGLFAYAAVKVVAPVFYALKRVRVPVTGTILAVAANVVFNIVLHPHYGFRVLALGTSVAALVNLAVLLYSFQRGYGGALRQDVLLMFTRVIVAATLMGGAVWAVQGAVQHAAFAVLGRGSLAAGAGLVASVPCGAVVYAGLCALMGIEEMSSLAKRLQQRLTRRFAGSSA